ncbi:MAG: XisI protein [Anaerolineaceae bacterium 4572_78]|nr:MAG: XisI protein [Anaerolineaceae bacterium 4572_78]
MGRINTYRNIIKKILIEFSQYPSTIKTLERITIFDETQNHYQLVSIGWLNKNRIYHCMFHFDIKDDKIWLQHNGTDVKIADKLVAHGISKKDIVLGFQPESYRSYTGFAIK